MVLHAYHSKGMSGDGVEVFAAVPFESSWELSVDGIEVRQSVALEWATAFLGKSGSVELHHHTSSSHKCNSPPIVALDFSACGIP